MFLCIMRTFAGLAHLVEHLTCNQGVVGSSPATGTKYKKAQFFNWAFLYLNSTPNQNTTKSATVNTGCADVPNTAKATDACK